MNDWAWVLMSFGCLMLNWWLTRQMRPHIVKTPGGDFMVRKSLLLNWMYLYTRVDGTPGWTADKTRGKRFSRIEMGRAFCEQIKRLEKESVAWDQRVK